MSLIFCVFLEWYFHSIYAYLLHMPPNDVLSCILVVILILSGPKPWTGVKYLGDANISSSDFLPWGTYCHY